MPDELTIRLKALDGQWETVGADRLRGIVPEHFTGDSDEWGNGPCSFQLRRDPGAVQPDLSAFTRCRVWVDGMKVWSGRVKETPSQDGDDQVINVAGVGMQYHLDQDAYDRVYVHSRMGDWRDIRSFPTADLSLFTTGPSVTTGDRVIVLAFGASTPVGTGRRAAAMLDLGAGGAAKRVVVSWEAVNVTASQVLRFSSDSAPGGTANVLTSLTLSAAGASTGTTAVTVSGNDQRYLAIQLLNNAATFTPAADETVRITAVRVFTDTAYEAGNVSILTADDVVNDALDHATLLLSTDRSEVKAGTFAIPDLALRGARTPREITAGVNAYENYETKVDVEDRMCFRPRASTPVYEIGEWSGAQFSDGSTNSDDVYNRAIIEATGPDGAQLGVSRYSVNVDPVPTQLFRFTFIASRGGPLPLTSTGGAITGPFLKGKAYLVRVRAGSGVVGGTGSATGQLRFGDLAAGDYVTLDLSGNAFPLEDVVWTPTATRAAATPEWTVTSETAGTGTDDRLDCDLKVSNYTILDRQTLMQTKILSVSSAITEAIGERFGDLYLQERRSMPFRGDFQAVGRGGVRRVLGGGSVHPAWLLRDTGQLVRCTDRVDPDTGGWGRKGRIVAVKYDHDTRTSQVSLDDNRGGFEALLARYSIIVG